MWLANHIFLWYFTVAGISGVPITWGPFESQPMCEYVRAAIIKILPDGNYTACTLQHIEPRPVN